MSLMNGGLEMRIVTTDGKEFVVDKYNYNETFNKALIHEKEILDGRETEFKRINETIKEFNKKYNTNYTLIISPTVSPTLTVPLHPKTEPTEKRTDIKTDTNTKNDKEFVSELMKFIKMLDN